MSAVHTPPEICPQPCRQASIISAPQIFLAGKLYASTSPRFFLAGKPETATFAVSSLRASLD